MGDYAKFLEITNTHGNSFVMYAATKFQGKWKCNSSLKYDTFCEKTGMDPEESKIAHLSRPILEIMATEDGFKETVILPNADNEILDTFHYVFGQKLTTFDRSVTWISEAKTVMTGKVKNIGAQEFSVRRELSEDGKQMIAHFSVRDQTATRKYTLQA